jgi:hypothetical protein
MRVLAPVRPYGGRVKPIGYRRNGAPIMPIAGGSPVMAPAQAQARPADEGPRVPFVRASYTYREKMRADSVTLATAQQSLQPIPITPGGFLRGIWIEVGPPTTSGVLGTAVLGSPTDFPFALLANVVLEDVNGQSIVGPITGYELYLANKYGGYFPNSQGDPEVNPGFTGTFANPYFIIWVPVEVRSDGLGSLPNTDARAQYRLVVTIDSSANILSTGTVTTQPIFPVTYWVDYWAQVEATSMTGEPQEQVPPGLGTTQFWYHEIPTVAAGAQTIKHNRVGNAIRTIIYILRNGAAAGAAQPGNQRVSNFTDAIKLRMDNRYLFSESPNLRRRGLQSRFNALTGPDGDPAVIGTPVKGILETGTLVLNFGVGVDYEPSPGDLGDWLETNEATFLQFEDTLSATVATLTILTNDVAPRSA